MYHESFEEGFDNHDSMLNNFYIDYNFVISNAFIFDATFRSQFAVKYFKIEKTSEKKNYRGLQYLSDNKFIHPPGRHYRNYNLSQIIYTTVLNYTELELLLISYSTQFLRIHPMIGKGSNFGENILLI